MRRAAALALFLAVAPAFGWDDDDRRERAQEEWRRAVEERDAARVPGDVQASEPAGPAPSSIPVPEPDYRPAPSGPRRSAGYTCSAFPRCARGGANLCKGVAHTLAGSLASARSDIVRRCIQANTPDPCGQGCAAQCVQAARCH